MIICFVYFVDQKKVLNYLALLYKVLTMMRELYAFKYVKSTCQSTISSMFVELHVKACNKHQKTKFTLQNMLP